MTTADSLQARMNIRSIAWPIFLEQLVRMSLMTVDVLMLSRYSDAAVAAVGLTGQMMLFLMLAYLIVGSGSAVLIGQNLGAGRSRDAVAYSQAGLTLTLIMALLVGAVFYFGTRPFISAYGLAPQVELYANQYLLIVGSCSIGIALSTILSTILRAFGHSRSPTVIQLFAGIINVVGNYIALFPPFGLPQTGVAGVAVATVASQVFASVACWIVIRKVRIDLKLRKCLTPDAPRLRNILRLGLPNAGESISYNLAQIAIFYMIAQLGTAALAAAAIAQMLARFMFVFALSLGNGAQILSSYLVGQQRAGELKSRVHRYWLTAVLVSFVVALIMVIFRGPLAAIFSADPDTRMLIEVLLIVSLLLEPGRAINLIVIQSMKGAGDVLFPVILGILCMWGIGVLAAYLLGIHWAWGLAGIWLGVALDEWTRGIVVILRWQRGTWMTMKRV